MVCSLVKGQDQIADLVAVAVVDLLEVVDVGLARGHNAADGVAGAQRLVDVVIAQRPVCWPWTSCGIRRSCSATSTAPTGTRSGSPPLHRPGRQARTALGEDLLPSIRLHDLRHTHATLLLADGVPVKVISERLGHASATITLTVYQHVHPGMGSQAADRFAALLEG